MPIKDITKVWDGTAADLFLGADPGTQLGFTGQVSITKESTYLDVTASQTGGQILDRRLQSEIYRVVIEFKEAGQADHFANWWIKGNADSKLHPGKLGASVPTVRLRVHPTIMADGAADFIFESLVFDKGPSMVLDGNGNHVHRVELITLPLTADLTTIDLGKIGYVAP